MEYTEDQIFMITGEYRLFHSFWIDGVRKIQNVDYEVDEGSTRVTIFAQTIEELDNGEHTAVAAFVKDDSELSAENYYALWNQAEIGDNMLDIVVQQFTVVFIDKPPPLADYDGEDNNNSGDNTDSDYTEPGNTTPGDNTGAGDTTQPDVTTPGETNPGVTAPDTTTDGANPGVAAPTDTATQPADATVGSAAPADAGLAAPGAVDTPPPDNPQQGIPPANNAPANNAPANNAPANTAPVDNAPTDDTSPDNTQEAPPTTGGGTGGVSGLPTGPDGKLFFNLDGSGAPMELSIDIPYGEFNDLYFDGVLWSRETDYTAREGSTVLTIAASQLEKYEQGEHTLLAGFSHDNVEITFMLNKPSAAPTTTPAAIVTPTVDTTAATAAANPVLFVLGGIVLVMLGGGTVLMVRKTRSA